MKSIVSKSTRELLHKRTKETKVFRRTLLFPCRELQNVAARKNNSLGFARSEWKLSALVMAKVALGKGLGALINTRVASPTPAPESGERVQSVNLAEIVPTPLQPRTQFRSERLQELIDSIRERGIIQPLIVRKKDGKFELIAGERRWRAAKEVGLTQAPVIIREASDQEVLELALVENLQREDLNAIEEAVAYSRLAKQFNLKQEEIAQKVGKSRAAVANSIRLLELHSQIQTWVAQGRVSVGHAKVLLSIKSHDEQFLIAENILKHNHTVRAVEKIVASHLNSQGVSRSTRKPAGLSPAFQHLQNRLQQHLATHVVLRHADKRGSIEIEYYGNDDLQRILGLIGLPQDEA
jgi:ParB family chromosome partitioning protein